MWEVGLVNSRCVVSEASDLRNQTVCQKRILNMQKQKEENVKSEVT